MSDLNDAGQGGGGEPEPPGRSRRSVLKGVTAGAAGLAVTALAGRALPTASLSGPTAAPAGRAVTASAAASEPVIVHIRDVGTGEMDVFRGTISTRVHDRELAARLVRAGG